MKTIYCLIFLVSLPLYAQTKRPKALVYGGYGACTEDCVTGAVAAAEAAGFETDIVYPKYYHKSLLDDVSVWIQPGGTATSQAYSMGTKMMADIKEFINKGGGYVGFCAGAFIATSKIGTSNKNGYGLIPGKTILYEADGYPTIENMTVLGNPRQIYWEGGPYFKLSDEDLKTAQVMGLYLRTNQPSFVRAPFGKGRVFVTGAHPEAPEWWRNYADILDKDGLDYGITNQMIKWAAGL